MNPDALSLARSTFMQATLPGPSRESTVLGALFARLKANADGKQLDVAELEEALDEEFPWRNQLVFQSRQLQPDELETWVQVIRWLVESLLAEDMQAEGNTQRVQVMLTALGALDIASEGLSAISDRFADSHVPTSIVSMLRHVRQVPEGFDGRSREWLRDLSDEVNAGNFKILQQAQRAFQPQFHSDTRTSAFLLWKLAPTELARLIDSQDNILLDMLVCRVLDANAPLFALQVDRVAFKFISLSWLVRVSDVLPAVDPVDVLVQLLLQVAQTPHWKAWLQATHEYPAVGSEYSKAVAEALTQLAEPQWKDFILALAPSTLRGSAEAVADILTHVARNLGSENTQPLWRLAFEHWDAWNYGMCEGHLYLGSPQACAFDFPVAMYYAHMAAAERDALERELRDAILHIEQRWFSSASELCTERNRLASRLRLVRHGRDLAAGATDALPPPVQPDSEYAEVRYRYHDVNQAVARMMRR